MKAEKLWKNILDSSKLVKNTDYNTKTDIGNKISNISSLVKKPQQIMT